MSAAKQPRLDKPPLDPLRVLGLDLARFWLQHLNPSDILTLSEVSKDYYRTVATIPRLINQLQLTIDESSDRQFKISHLRNSKRVYKKIVIRSIFQYRHDSHELLYNLAQNLTHLETTVDFPMHMSLPKLQTLIMIIDSKGKIFKNGLLTSVRHLKKLSFSGNPDADQLARCLMLNRSLKHLELVGRLGSAQSSKNQKRFFEWDLSNLVFSVLFSQPSFHLTTLKLNSVSFVNDFAEDNFFNFISVNLNTIRNLKLLKCSYTILDFILNHAAGLKKLTFSPEPYSEWIEEAEEIGFSFSMQEDLEIVELIMCDDYFILAVLEENASMKKLYVSGLSPNVLKAAVKNPKLEELRYSHLLNCSLSHEDILVWYEGVKTHPMVNKNLKIIQI